MPLFQKLKYEKKLQKIYSSAEKPGGAYLQIRTDWIIENAKQIGAWENDNKMQYN